MLDDVFQRDHGGGPRRGAGACLSSSAVETAVGSRGIDIGLGIRAMGSEVVALRNGSAAVHSVTADPSVSLALSDFTLTVAAPYSVRRPVYNPEPQHACDRRCGGHQCREQPRRAGGREPQSLNACGGRRRATSIVFCDVKASEELNIPPCVATTLTFTPVCTAQDRPRPEETPLC